MKKKPYDYSGFSLRRLNEPQFSHIRLLAGWIFYFAMYFITENLIPAEKCHPIHCALDDLIPFCEWFLIPYVFWYALVVVSLGWFMLYNIESFKNLSKFIIITQAVAMAAYILYPTRQDLRPETFLNDNLLTRCVGFLYSFDTNTGVCPSLHVAYSIGILSVWLKEKANGWWKAFVTFAVIMICLSTMFIKQHSAVDFFAALPVCLLAELVLYGRYWKNRMKKSV